MKRFKIDHKILAMIAAGALLTSVLTACAKASEGSETTDTAASSSVSSSAEITTEEAFTDKDLETGYDESGSQTITLSGSSAVTDSSSVRIDGSVITIRSEGTYVLTGELDDGYVVVDAGDSDDIRIVLKNASISSSDYAALYCLNADNVYITLEDGTDNILTNTGAFDSKDDNNVDGAVFAKTDLTINGSGSLNVGSTEHGIVGKDNVTVTGGTITISSEKDGIQANDSVSIQNSVIGITCGKDGIQSDCDDDPEKGYIFISSGDITINAEDDGITASSALQIDDGTVNITGSYEGIEAQNITVNGGSISLVSSDDGLNAVSDSGETMRADSAATLKINGGEIYVRSEGDGIDSNGSFEMTGGTLIVMGPVRGGNGSLDVNGSAVITGGTVIMAGASDMASNFTNASQGAILVSTGSQSEGSGISVTDPDGNVIIQVTADCSFQSVLISSPDLKTGSTYTLKAGNYEETISLSENVYGETGFGPGGMPWGMPDSMPDDIPDGMGNGNPFGFPGDERGRKPQ